MQIGQENDTFHTGQLAHQLAGDIASIVQRVNAAAPYQSFLQSYRQKLAGATPARPG